MSKKNSVDFWGSENTLYHDDSICLLKPIRYTTPRVNPKVNYGLWVVMICSSLIKII